MPRREEILIIIFYAPSRGSLIVEKFAEYLAPLGIILVVEESFVFFFFFLEAKRGFFNFFNSWSVRRIVAKLMEVIDDF